MGTTAPGCDGLCVTAADVGVSVPGQGDAVAYPHPGCPLHAPAEVCGCGMPDRCLSPTHGQIGMGEALAIRHAQNPLDTRARPAEACEGCDAPSDRMHHDVEGVPLCPSCWLAEPSAVMARCRYCNDPMPPDAFRPGYCEPCEDERRHVCGGRDPMYPGQTCTFPPGHDWPCIDPSAAEG